MNSSLVNKYIRLCEHHFVAVDGSLLVSRDLIRRLKQISIGMRVVISTGVIKLTGFIIRQLKDDTRFLKNKSCLSLWILC